MFIRLEVKKFMLLQLDLLEHFTDNKLVKEGLKFME